MAKGAENRLLIIIQPPFEIDSASSILQVCCNFEYAIIQDYVLHGLTGTTLLHPQRLVVRLHQRALL